MNKKLGMMALTGALALVACSQGGSPGGGTTNHTLTINLSGVSSAPITITDSKGNVVSNDTVSSGAKKSLAAGTYTVTPGAVNGYTTPAAQTANLNTSDVALNFTYTATTPQPPALAKTVNLVTIKDENNVALPFQREVNDNKVATLFTAQTEESVCVIAKVLDANSNPVANSSVTLTVTDTYANLNGGIVVADGCGSGINAQAATTSPVVSTDANGIARFRLFATYATPNSGLNSIYGIGPAKIVVQAKDAQGNQLDPLELKGFFLNMSHLYVGEATPGNEGYGTLYQTKTRVGDSTGFTNVFGTRNNPTNEADFGIFTYLKQPQLGPVMVPANVTADAFSYLAPGYVQYDITGQDAASFMFVDQSGSGRTAYSTDPNFGKSAAFQPITASFPYDPAATHFRDYGNPTGRGVRLVPRPGVTVPTDRPLNVSVKATYVFETTYGNTTYDFPLKDVTINKTWQSSFLTINKTVDNHVLTWSGPAVTMAATGARTAEPLIANYTITVKNSSQTDAYNVTIKDSLPPELGLAVDNSMLTNVGTETADYPVTANGVTTPANTPASAGGTYDTSLHQVTWNYTNTPALGMIPAGKTVTLTFPVYARQKPGFQWDSTVDYSTYFVKPRVPGTGAAGSPFNPYPDPYITRNGANGPADVTVAFFPTANASLRDQVVTDFNPPDDRADIWVVRPEFQLTKTLLSENPSAIGASNFYQIQLTQIDQIGNGGLYHNLAQKYPYEFTKTSTATTAGDVARANPYGVNLNLADAWDYGLDFTNATAFNIFDSSTDTKTNPDGTIVAKDSSITPKQIPSFPTTGRSITWKNNNFQNGLFERDDFGVAQVQLTSSVASPTSTTDPRFNGWRNCAYLNPTDNLNQPGANETEFLQSWYYQQQKLRNQRISRQALPPNYAPWLYVTPPQIEVGTTANPATALATGINAGPPSTSVIPGTFLPVQVGLESCVPVVVVNNATSALTFTNRGEYFGTGEPTGDIVPANAKDGYAIGQNFYYKFDSQNTGTAPAIGVNVTFVRSNDNVTFPTGGTYEAYVGPVGGPFTPTATGTLNGDGSVSFSNITVPAGQFVRFVLQGAAQFQGTTNVNGTLTYQPSGSAQVILNTQEVTTVNQ